MLGICFHQSRSFVAVVVLVWRSIRIPRLAHDQDIVAQSDWVSVHCDGSDVDIGVVAGCLAGGRAIEVPFWEVVDRGNLLIERLKKRNVSFWNSPKCQTRRASGLWKLRGNRVLQAVESVTMFRV